MQAALGVDSGTASLSRMTASENRSRWIALIVMCVGMLMIVLDATIVNVALPSIQHDLHFSQSSLAWVVNAYLITFGGLLLLAGRLGDLASRRGVFLTGLAIFVAASALCGFAHSQGLLVAARFIQGAGGALTSAVILGMIVTMFPEPREQAKAIGVYSFVASAGGSVGLLAGGVITQSINWHWIFFVNLPIGVATAFFALRYVARDTGAGLRAGADLPGAALITAGLMLLVYTIVEPAAKHGWGSAQTLGLGAAALALLAGFVVREATARDPLMPFGILRSRNLSGANIVQALMVAGMFGMFFLGALYLRLVLGYDPLKIGLAFLPATIAIGTLSLGFAERLIMRLGARTTLLPGLVSIAAGLALFSRAPVHASYVADVLPPMLLMGIGAGMSFPALMTLAMSGVKPTEAGLASGLVNTSLQVGGALGLAVLATLSTTRSNHLLHSGHSLATALTSGYRLAFLIGMGFALAAVAVGAIVLERVAAPEADLPEDLAYSEAA